MTSPLKPFDGLDPAARPAPLRKPGAFRPLDPGFLDWVSRKNAPPLRQLELPLPPDLQVDDEMGVPPPRDRRR